MKCMFNYHLYFFGIYIIFREKGKFFGLLSVFWVNEKLIPYSSDFGQKVYFGDAESMLDYYPDFGDTESIFDYSPNFGGTESIFRGHGKYIRLLPEFRGDSIFRGHGKYVGLSGFWGHGKYIRLLPEFRGDRKY